MRPSLAFGLLAVTLLQVAASVVLIAMSWGTAFPASWGFRGFPATFAVPASLVGILIVRRHGRHIVGWAALTSGALFSAQLFAQEYLAASYFALPEPLPMAATIGWLNAWIWVPAAMILLMSALYFPDGRLASSTWRWALWLGMLGIVVLTAGAIADGPWIEAQMLGVTPPYDPRDLGVLASYAQPTFLAGFMLSSVAGLGCGLSVAYRFRRAGSTERQQIKWFALAAGLTGVVAAIDGVTMAWIGNDPTIALAKPGQYLLIVAIALLPVSIGIAILRHRLFDIDVLIDRTLVYGTLSATLVATYVAAVVLLQTLLRPFTAGSDLAVAASTLLVVALFQPLRGRIQDAVDRRFYRSRYDAARTLDAFTARLRADVDLDSIHRDLVQVLDETFRPAHASVWLRERAS